MHKKWFFPTESSKSDSDSETSAGESDFDLPNECHGLADQKEIEKEKLGKENFILAKIASKRTMTYFVADVCELVFQIQQLKTQL